MALTDSEITRIKAELGFTLLSIANPYIGTAAIFETIIQPYLTGNVATTSSTSVTAASAPTPVTLTVASADDLSSGARVIIDVDTRQETVTIQNLSGTSMTVQLQKAHSGTYPVVLEGPESLVRECLRRIAEVKTELGSTFGIGAIKKVDEIEFHRGGDTMFGSLGAQLAYWRRELAALLGIESMWERRGYSATKLAIY